MTSTSNDTSKPITLHLQTLSWMREVHPVNHADLTFYMFGEIVERPGFLIVVDGKAGCSWYYCIKHNYVFGLRGQCEHCRNAEAQAASADPEVPNGAGVQPLHTP